MDSVLETIYESVVDGAQKVTQAKVSEALESGLKAEVILNEGLVNCCKSYAGRPFNFKTNSCR